MATLTKIPKYMVEHVARLPCIPQYFKDSDNASTSSCRSNSSSSSGGGDDVVSLSMEVNMTTLTPPPGNLIPTALFYNEEMTLHKPLIENGNWDGEKPERITHTIKELEESGLLSLCNTAIPCRQATPEELCLVHTSKHVELMLSLRYCVDREVLREVASRYNTIFMNEKSIDAALYACGSVIKAVETVMHTKESKHAACLVRPPGHHAEDGQCMGFSIFNNVAVAAKYAQQNLGVERILIVDWDVHHGNGIQDMFKNDTNVCYFSVHRWDHGAFYPGFIVDSVGPEAGSPLFVGGDKVEAAKGRSINLGWFGSGDYGAPPMGDGDYKAAFERLLMPIARSFNPSLIIVAAGFDAARGDHLGDCDVTPSGYSYMTSQLMSLGCPVTISLEGGYNIPSVKYSFGACVAALLGISKESGESFAAPRREALSSIAATIAAQRIYWPGILDE